MFLNYYVDEKLKNQLCKRFLYLNEVCDQLNGVAVEDLPLGEDRTIYENYLNKKYTKENDDKLKSLMQKRIVAIQAEKGISNYHIYKALKLNPGNINAFLKNGDTGKNRLNTVRNIIAFVNQ